VRPAPFAFEDASWHGSDEFSTRRGQVGEICKLLAGLRASGLAGHTSCLPVVETLADIPGGERPVKRPEDWRRANYNNFGLDKATVTPSPTRLTMCGCR
jgi:hypothetical protein